MRFTDKFADVLDLEACAEVHEECSPLEKFMRQQLCDMDGEPMSSETLARFLAKLLRSIYSAEDDGDSFSGPAARDTSPEWQIAACRTCMAWMVTRKVSPSRVHAGCRGAFMTDEKRYGTRQEAMAAAAAWEILES